MRQLAGIGGGRSLGFGPNRVRSLPDGVAQVLERLPRHVERAPTTSLAADQPGSSPYRQRQRPRTRQRRRPRHPSCPLLSKIGDLCPECGQAAVVNEEGCRKCYACGYSEC